MERMASLFALTPAYVWKHYCCGNWFYNTPKYPRLSKKKNSINLKKKSELLSAVLLAINDNKDCESALENP